ncbi:MAG: phosphate butyryltransferase [Candidatus Muiribacterium halophilum]|uniref:Phosphate butyryltransferase n=1 Tax=Muiribacterium halophilum TaxID=2053465 RepID=A0A2N5ZBY3_MUIH1|nr:MAG: phosphate butyryltransferase [Candidatus Muirbacterium halophilum]
MYSSFEDIFQEAKKQTPKKVAVVMAADPDLLEAISEAMKMNLIQPILIGPKEKILDIIKKWEREVEIIDCLAEDEAARKGVELIRDNKASMIMKGKIKTGTFLKAIVDKKSGVSGGNILSHVLVFEKDNRLRIITDGGMIIAPDLKEKISIINNSVRVAISLGRKTPKVAPICAVETVNDSMEATLDAALLAKMNSRKQIKDCIIDGPLALDNALSKKAAEHKGIKSDVAGDADILLVPDIEAGNILGKSVYYIAGCECAGMIAGPLCPVIMLSRADSPKTRLNSIALAMVCAKEGETDGK